jgi:hypothetical protein
MNNWVLSLLAYALVAGLVGIRLMFVGRRILRETGVPGRIYDSLSRLILDALCWGYFILWFGLKSFLEDLR